MDPARARFGRRRSDASVTAFTDAVLASIGEAVYSVDPDGRVATISPLGEQLLGWSSADLVGRPAHDVIHGHGDDEPCPCRAAIASRQLVQRRNDAFFTKAGGRLAIDWTAAPVLVDAGVAGAVIAFRQSGQADTLQVVREQERELRSEAERNALLVDVARQLAFERDLDSLVQVVTDTVSLTKAAFGAFFYDVTNDAGESFVLYTLSGADRADFDGFPVPRNTPVFGPTFRGERTVRFDDVTAQPEYGTMAPFHGMPPGHLPVRSYLAVPVVSRRGEAIGGLFFAHPEPGMFTTDDERLVEGVAAQAAVAIDNARLFEHEHRLAETLQLSLLPKTLSTLPGVCAASRYLPADVDAHVGGDWYDLVPLPGGAIGAVIGDVAGHSIHAAAVMGRIRNVLRCYALEGHAPTTVMERINRFVAITEPAEIITCCYAEIDQDQRTVTVVSAGHPPPVLITDNGTATFVDVDPGPPLGAVDDARYGERTVQLDSRSVVLLYTDGLVESRNKPLEVGMARLLEAAATEHTKNIFTAQEIAGWGNPDLRHTVQLLVSELVSNAVLSGPGAIQLTLTDHGTHLRTDVRDTTRSSSSTVESPIEVTRGRGFHIIDALSDRWGVELNNNRRTVWFELDTPDS